MINSLSKDSHMTQSLCYSINSGNSQSDCHQSKLKSHRSVYYSALDNSSVGKSVNRPVEISFNGSPAFIVPGTVEKTVEKVAEKAKKEGFLERWVDEKINRSDRIKNFLIKNGKFKTFLNFADDNQVTFNAAFALILTGLFRPVAIMLTPSSKKNVDDKKYASAQSIASGLIGLAVAIVFSNPISAAVGKIFDENKISGKRNLEKYITNPNVRELFKNNDATHTKLAKDTFKQMGDLIPAIPKAIFTIAIIPIILKTVFGLEKHKHKDKAEQSVHDNLTLNFQSSVTPQKKVFNNFAGGVK